jgi:hypothetical protein
MGQVVNGMISVYAYPNPRSSGMAPSAREPGFAEDVRAAGVYFIVEYDNVQDLANQILGIQNGLRGRPVLSLLEIHAHGSPSEFNGWCGWQPTDIRVLAKPHWSDISKLYLTGCNTGTTDPQASDPARGAVPIAQVVANQIPVVPKAFRFTVFGTLGYSYGCHALGTTQTWEVGGCLGIHYGAPFRGSRDTEPDPTNRDPASGAYKPFWGPNSA